MKAIMRSEKGVALGMALGAIVIIGVLVAGAVFVSTQDYRISANTVRQTRAEALADLGLNRLLNEWDKANNKLATGATLTKVYNVSGGTATVVVTRLPGYFFWVTSEAQAGALGSQATARRRYGMLWRLNVPEMSFLGAVTTGGQLIVSGNATVSGKDVTPTGWSACSTADIAGVAMADQSKLDTKGSCSTKGCISGSPNYLQTTAAADSNTYFNYGSSTYQTLAAAAGITLPAGTVLTGLAPSVSGGQCVTTLQTNWGDPNRASPAGACESYFPIIHALGDLKITTGIGQGILLVDGSLTIAGNFVFTGAIVARGSVSTFGTGTKITGAVMAATVSLDSSSTLTGNTGIQYSSCALQSVMQSSAYPAQAKQKGWADLY